MQVETQVLSGETTPTKPTVDWVTLIGLTLIIGPLTVVGHELGGHAATCLAIGARVTAIGAFYVDCIDASGGVPRIVSMAGTMADILIFALSYWLWPRAKGDLMRLSLWLVFSVKGMVAAGYFLFSGATGIGDWGPGIGGGIGPLPHPFAWRAGLFLIGLFAYIRIVRLSTKALHAMIGGGDDAAATQRKVALGFYFIFGGLAVLIGLVNPVGIVITITSALASTFGGTAGMITIARRKAVSEPIPFAVGGSIPLLLCGLAVAITFAAVLGPTISFPL
jgi:pimeloyl-ACP methyl ester carboxylesterase